MRMPKPVNAGQPQCKQTPILENAVHEVATNGSTGTEDGCITQLLAKLLTVLLDFAGSLTLAVAHAWITG